MDHDAAKPEFAFGLKEELGNYFRVRKKPKEPG